MNKQQIGVIGMAVMGRNIALNIESRGYTVSIYNRTASKTEAVIEENPAKKLVAASSRKWSFGQWSLQWLVLYSFLSSASSQFSKLNYETTSGSLVSSRFSCAIIPHWGDRENLAAKWSTKKDFLAHYKKFLQEASHPSARGIV